MISRQVGARAWPSLHINTVAYCQSPGGLKENIVELIEIQVSATLALLLGHFITVMYNRWRKAPRSPLYVSATSRIGNWEPLRTSDASARGTLANRRGTRAEPRPVRR
jgi:hypothetical protein